MQKETQPIDITNLPDLLKLAEEVQSTRQPVVLKRGPDAIAVIAPLEPATVARGTRRRGQANPNDWLLRLADIGADSPPADQATDVSANKYQYLAEAYADRHEPKE
jgi:hypothetical protein